MQNILTVKELITSIDGGSVKVGDKVCVHGEVSNKDYGTKKLIYTIVGKNSRIVCFDSNKGNKDIVKLNKPLYVEGKLDIRLGEYVLNDITKVDRNVMRQKMLREYELNKTEQNKLHLLIVSGDENGAIRLIETSNEIDVNYLYNHTKLVIMAINYQMPKLFDTIINHKDFKADESGDDFGNSLLIALLYLYGSNIKKDERKIVKEFINSVFLCNKFDLNEEDINKETALIVSCRYKELNWFTEMLCSVKSVDVNKQDDFGFSAMDKAIKERNIEVIDMLLNREDLEMSDSTKSKLAKIKR